MKARNYVAKHMNAINKPSVEKNKKKEYKRKAKHKRDLKKCESRTFKEFIIQEDVPFIFALDKDSKDAPKKGTKEEKTPLYQGDEKDDTKKEYEKEVEDLEAGDGEEDLNPYKFLKYLRSANAANN